MILCPGDTLFWLNPDDSLCNKWVEIVCLNEYTVTVSDGDTQFDVMPDELQNFDPEEV